MIDFVQVKEAGTAVLKKLKAIKDEDDIFTLLRTDKAFELAVQMGEIPGFSVVDKFGSNAVVSATGNVVGVNEQNVKLPYPLFGAAPQLYLSCDDVANVGKNVTVKGLAADGTIAEEVVVTNGRNNVALTTVRYRADFIDMGDEDRGNEFPGNVYVHSDTSPTDGVPTPMTSCEVMASEFHQRSLKAAYTIPKGYVGFLYKGELGIRLSSNSSGLADYANFVYRSARVDKIFTTKKDIGLMVAKGVYSDLRDFKDIIPALTDVSIEVLDVSVDMGVWATFTILLVEEGKLSQAFLTAIGQPT